MTDLTTFTDAQLVGVYRTLRLQRDDAKAAFVVEQAPVLEKLKELEAEGNTRLTTRENNSFATDEGTCYKSIVRSFTAKNKTAFLDWVRENGLWDLLDVRPAKAEVEAYLEKHQELPVGLNTTSKVNVNFTAPRKK
jgi:hypothetical protein